MPAECRGRYNAGIYTQLNNICDDCYNLFKEPDVHQLCRSATVDYCMYIYRNRIKTNVQDPGLCHSK